MGIAWAALIIYLCTCCPWISYGAKLDRGNCRYQLLDNYKIMRFPLTFGGLVPCWWSCQVLMCHAWDQWGFVRSLHWLLLFIWREISNEQWIIQLLPNTYKAGRQVPSDMFHFFSYLNLVTKSCGTMVTYGSKSKLHVFFSFSITCSCGAQCVIIRLCFSMTVKSRWITQLHVETGLNGGAVFVMALTTHLPSVKKKIFLYICLT